MPVRKYDKSPRPCEYCGEDFVWTKRHTQRFCCNECRISWQKQNGSGTKEKEIVPREKWLIPPAPSPILLSTNVFDDDTGTFKPREEWEVRLRGKGAGQRAGRKITRFPELTGWVDLVEAAGIVGIRWYQRPFSRMEFERIVDEVYTEGYLPSTRTLSKRTILLKRTEVVDLANAMHENPHWMKALVRFEARHSVPTPEELRKRIDALEAERKAREENPVEFKRMRPKQRRQGGFQSSS
jgi:hypothetical protein